MTVPAANYDDLCTFDKDGVCRRHKVKHEGRNYQLSQDRTQVGHHFRKQWDGMMQFAVGDITDVCTFGEDGVCVRHGFKHQGKAHDISQEVSERGHRVRQKWDEVTVQMRMTDQPKKCNCGEKKGTLH